MKSILRHQAGAAAFFYSILIWGIGVGCFAAAMNNFLSSQYHMNSLERGWLEFFREFPGLALVFILAALHRVSNWRVMRIGTKITMIAALLLLVPGNKIWVTAVIMLWSTGEHLVMPVRYAIAMHVAKPEHAGRSLGLLTAIMNFGSVAGSMIVALIFLAGTLLFQQAEARLFKVVWGAAFLLMAASVVRTYTKHAPHTPAKRPRLHWNLRRYFRFYGLELFYGARKQVFLTFAPYVLIREYGFSTAAMAILLGACATINIFAAPFIGRVTDRWGYRNVMIWDTVILAFVCLLYGFAGRLFPAKIALAVVCVNFLLDAMLSTTSLATNIYVRDLADTQDEMTASITTGISINHFIAILSAPLGGWVWQRYGVGTLFSFAAIMAVCNSLFAMTIPKKRPVTHAFS